MRRNSNIFTLLSMEMFDQFRLCDDKTDAPEQVWSAFDILYGYRRLNIVAELQAIGNKDLVELSNVISLVIFTHGLYFVSYKGNLMQR